MNRFLLLACLALAVLPLASTASAATLTDFVDYSRLSPTGQILLPGRLFIPPEATSTSTPRPLIVFLHGGGAAGTNNTTQVEHTPDYLLDEAKRRGAFLYVPQAPTNWSPTSVIDSVATMINRVVEEQNADARRLYATGYSNGGGGTWNLLSRNPGRFAAALAVAGVAPAPGFVPSNLLGTAIFALHARDDATVPPDRSRNVVAAVLTAGGATPPVYPIRTFNDFLVYNSSIEFHQTLAGLIDPATTTFFSNSRPGLDVLYYEGFSGGHSGPVGIYYTPFTYDWMFAHALPVPEPAIGLFVAIAAAGLWPSLRRRPTVAASRRDMDS